MVIMIIIGLCIDIGIWAVCGMITKLIFDTKNYNGGFWLGFLLGIIGIIIALCLPKKKSIEINAAINEGNEEIVICQNCGMQIFEDEKICSNCGKPKK